MSFPGMPGMGGRPGASGVPGQEGMSDYEQNMIKAMQAGMESCPAKAAMAGVMGAGLGAMFGVFMSSMRYDSVMTPQGAEIRDLPMRQQLKIGLKDIGKTAYSSGKNFGFIGGVYTATECTIEKFRGKNDLYNGLAAGCLTGGALAIKAGPQAAAIGAAGFGLFSLAIDAYMRMEETDHVRKII